MFNRIKQFLENRPDPVTGSSFTSAYRFWKDTELSRTTAYRLYNDSSYIPTGDVLDKICSAYQIKPGLILDWEPNDPSQLTTSQEEKLQDPSTLVGQKKENFSGQSSKNTSLLTIFGEERESA